MRRSPSFAFTRSCAATAGTVVVGLAGGWGEVRGWVMACVFLLVYLVAALLQPEKFS